MRNILKAKLCLLRILKIRLNPQTPPKTRSNEVKNAPGYYMCDKLQGQFFESSNFSFLFSFCDKPLKMGNLSIYPPMIYTAPCIMFWMHAYPLRGQVGGVWALEIKSFLDLVK